jgi:hypothetical protein
MKTIILSILIFVSNICLGQMSEETMRALGIAPHREISSFIPPLSSNYSFFDTVTYFESYVASSHNGFVINKHKNCTFLFEGDLLITSLSDQFSRFRSYGVIKKEEDKDFTFIRHQCLDNSGTEMYINFVCEKSTNVQVIILQYKRDLFFEFEVSSKTVPVKVFDILDNIEELGVIYDQNFGEHLSNEEVKTFFSQFGNPDLIMKLILADMYSKKHKKH